MKKKILTVSFAIATLFTTAFATDKGKNQHAETTREVAIHEKFESIEIGANIKVVLVPGTASNSISIVGTQDYIDLINVKINNDQMVITAKKNISAKKIVVYVPVNDLAYIELKDGASISGEGTLRFTDLTVLLNADSHLNLKAVGKIEVESANNCELILEKYEKSKLLTKAP